MFLVRFPILLAVFLISIGLIFSIVCVDQLRAHQFEDGFVERSVAIVIRPDFTTVNYSIGANETTQQQLIDHWTSEIEKSNQPDPAQMAADFPTQFSQHVARRLQIQIDQRPVQLEFVDLILTPRHHVEATVVLKFATPKPTSGKQVIQLSFHDGNFDFYEANATPSSPAANGNRNGNRNRNAKLVQPLKPIKLGGAFRYACKATGGAMLSRSTVAPILVRAERFEDKALTPEKLDSNLKFEVEVIVPQ